MTILSLLSACGGNGSTPDLPSEVAAETDSVPLTEGNSYPVQEAGFLVPEIVYRQGELEVYLESISFDGRQSWGTYSTGWGEPTSELYPLGDSQTVWSTEQNGLVLLDHDAQEVFDVNEPGALNGEVAADVARSTLYFASETGREIYRLRGGNWTTITLPGDLRATRLAFSGDSVYGIGDPASATASAFELPGDSESPVAIDPPPAGQIAELQLTSAPGGVVAWNARVFSQWNGTQWTSVVDDTELLQTLADRQIEVCPEGTVYVGRETGAGGAAPGLCADSLAGPYAPINGLPIEVSRVHCDESGPILSGDGSIFMPDDSGWHFAVERPTGRQGQPRRVLDLPSGYAVFGAVPARLDGDLWRPFHDKYAEVQQVGDQYVAFVRQDAQLVEMHSTDLVAWEDGPTWIADQPPALWQTDDGLWIALLRTTEVENSSDGSYTKNTVRTRVFHRTELNSEWTEVYDGETQTEQFLVTGEIIVKDTGPDGGAISIRHQLSSGRLVGTFDSNNIDVSDDNGATWSQEQPKASLPTDFRVVGIGPGDALLLTTDESAKPDGSVSLTVLAQGGLGEKLDSVDVKPPTGPAGDTLRILPRSLSIGRDGRIIGLAGDPWPRVFKTDAL